MAIFSLAGGGRAPVVAPAAVPASVPVGPPPYAGGRMTLAQLRALAASVGFPDPVLAAAVAMAESSGDPRALGDAGSSYGLWQINVPAHPEWRGRESQLFDPVTNARAALGIAHGGTVWSPWTTYNTGAYRQYMGDAA